jgi:equilibrative nucleoside transporter 1/2/3
MDRIRSLFASRVHYEPIENEVDVDGVGVPEEDEGEAVPPRTFSWLEYFIFLLLGIAMLWAWNMFMAAAPYFHNRFQSREWAVKSYQPSILSVSTITNLACVLVLAKRQENASYPRRIILSLVITTITFSLLALSTIFLRNVAVGVYFFFLMVMVFSASFATGISQNGVFAYVSGFGCPRYTQAIMVGQAVAGVLPCTVQILSVLAIPAQKGNATNLTQQESSNSAFVYFITSTGVFVSTLIAFLYHLKNPSFATTQKLSQESNGMGLHPHRKNVGLWILFKKLHWLALSSAVCFAVTMAFPVFTVEIESVHDPANRPALLEPAAFIPLAFLVWNTGDLIGRLSSLIPGFSLVRYPLGLFIFSVLRLIFIPLYLLCNVHGRGAVINSDFFYLAVVQLLFGITNGYIASCSVISATQRVPAEEREAAGGFMGITLVAGLSVGSLLSFFIAVA